MFNKNIFGNQLKETSIEDQIANSNIIFVSDAYAEDYVGGAELTTDTFYKNSSSLKVVKLRSNQVNSQLIQHGIMKHWVFFNYSSLNLNLIPVIIANLKYSIVI